MRKVGGLVQVAIKETPAAGGKVGINELSVEGRNEGSPVDNSPGNGRGQGPGMIVLKDWILVKTYRLLLGYRVRIVFIRLEKKRGSLSVAPSIVAGGDDTVDLLEGPLPDLVGIEAPVTPCVPVDAAVIAVTIAPYLLKRAVHGPGKGIVFGYAVLSV